MAENQALRNETFSGLRKLSGAPAPLGRRTGGNENTGLIKVIAILCMVTDHVGAVFFPGNMYLRVIGRIAFPLFAWCLCVGAEYTRNIWLYALRLFLIGLLSQPFYKLALNHEWYELNVFATLLVSLLGIAAIRENKFGSRYWGPALSILAACAVAMDYNWQGVLFIFLLYACRRQRASIAAIMIAYCLYWGYGTYSITALLGLPQIDSIPFLPKINRLLADVGRLQFWSILAMPLVIWPMRQRLRLPKWLCYPAYAVHLLVIYAIRHWLEIEDFFNQWW